MPLALDRSEPFALGHAGFAAALARALAVVAARASRFVGGVDSHHDPAVLDALDEDRRLHAEGAWDGFIPSEAAAFVLVGSVRGGDLPSRARVAAVATGMEPDPLPEDATPGEAATEVVRAVATALPSPVPWVLPDVNGERHRVKEWMFVRIRNRERIVDGRTVETRLYEELGDVGAASGLEDLDQRLAAWHRGFVERRSARGASAAARGSRQGARARRSRASWPSSRRGPPAWMCVAGWPCRSSKSPLHGSCCSARRRDAPRARRGE